MSASPPIGPDRVWRLCERSLTLGRRPLLMGILNVTPDSFSDGGRYVEPAAAVDRAHELVAAGADLLDIGGESTRPGSQPVPFEEELRRVVPVFEAVRDRVPVPLSVDTSKAEVARAALEAGADVINDVTALRADPRMPEVAARYGAGVVAMHMQGEPRTMQEAPAYGNVVEEVFEFLQQCVEQLVRQGIDRARIVVDPGIGFGKTLEHNLALLNRVERFADLGRPLCVGHSRKKIIGTLTGRSVEDRLYGTIGVALALCCKGVDIIRVHDVGAVRDALDLYLAVLRGTS